MNRISLKEFGKFLEGEAEQIVKDSCLVKVVNYAIEHDLINEEFSGELRVFASVSPAENETGFSGQIQRMRFFFDGFVKYVNEYGEAVEYYKIDYSVDGNNILIFIKQIK